MQIVECTQGEQDWWEARCGVPTSSEFDKILTPTKMEVSRSNIGYLHKLIAERLRGMPDEGFVSEWMKRGHEYEEEAADWYAMRFKCDPQKVGFCLEDGGRYGCSPDRIGDGWGLEIKCPSPGVQVGYLLGGRLPTTYKLQVLGGLLVTGFERWEFLSYHPDLKPLLVTVRREDVADELKALSAALDKFCDKLEAQYSQLKEAA